ncbi:MAG: hypothetical protein H6Q15_2278 [Bacteroidetes bacterium]|nr:hypothetical protein [Bacteroidota bacterium]
MIHKGIEYFTFEELRPIALKEMRDKLLNATPKFIGNINKTFDNKVDIGKWIKMNGYIKHRLMIDGKRSVFYYKP